ncbi:hypothetical protein KAFR_0E04180 [Kazachstania africana CBS 2517]|uniref:Origin recognition complex subunit 1 n=1 Tax=Kazachstania africana (strain ATCC 22294 / BCRC 22015 / CBS 2517 / CECT 1963 / NBRC 1671 / NRRL Y-8276) TaxID=1071382 RepID=H2AW19_KAZAF|nr:hypothetical protein KAFR_0E04180 [Kazachstania africana CBS 2517]CCF58569.1 hypothetical protein KAFR_0E04180 [Kazachstania africana CBS 2517]
MATSQKDLGDWNVVTTDEAGNIIFDTSRRSRKRGVKENFYLQRSDNISFRRGDSVIMRDAATDTYSVYLVHEIRQHTLNNVVEIWAFSYLRWFELKPIPYYREFDPDVLLDKRSSAEYLQKLQDEIDKNELYLTAELTEIWLKDFIGVANIYDEYHYISNKSEFRMNKDFYVKYICEPTAENFVKIDIKKEIDRIKTESDPKLSEQHLKRISVPRSRALPLPKPRNKQKKLSQSQPKEVKPNLQSSLSDNASSNKLAFYGSSQPSNIKNNGIKLEAPISNKSAHNKLAAFESNSVTTLATKPVTTPATKPVTKSRIISQSLPYTTAAQQIIDTEINKVQRLIDKEEERITQQVLSKEASEENGSLPQNQSDSSYYTSAEETASTAMEKSGNAEVEKGKTPDNLLNKNTKTGREAQDDDSSDDSPLSTIRKKRRLLGNKSTGSELRRLESSEEPLSIKIEDGEQTEQQKLLSGNGIERDASTTPQSSVTLEDVHTVNPGQNNISEDTILRIREKYTNLMSKVDYLENTDFSNITSFKELIMPSSEIDIAQLENRLRNSRKTENYTDTIYSRLNIRDPINSDITEFENKIIEIVDKMPVLQPRSGEFSRLYTKIFKLLRDCESKAIYIGGPTGSGKTTIVEKCFEELELSAQQNELPIFKRLKVDGYEIINANDCYELVWSQLSGEKLSSGAALESLQFYFANVPRHKKRQIVITLDSLDIMVSKGQDILYNFFNWTTLKNSKLILIAIASNTELPRKLLGEQVSSRIEYDVFTFKPYDKKALYNIACCKLEELNCIKKYWKDMGDNTPRVASREEHGDIRQLDIKIDENTVSSAARKISIMTRNVNDIILVCKKSVDVATTEYLNMQKLTYTRIEKYSDVYSQHISMEHVLKALSQKNDVNNVAYLNNCSLVTKLFLLAMLLKSHKMKEDEVKMKDVIEEIDDLFESDKISKEIKDIRGALFGNEEKINVEVIAWDLIAAELMKFDIIEKSGDSISFKISIDDIKEGISLNLYN